MNYIFYSYSYEWKFLILKKKKACKNQEKHITVTFWNLVLWFLKTLKMNSYEIQNLVHGKLYRFEHITYFLREYTCKNVQIDYLLKR